VTIEDEELELDIDGIASARDATLAWDDELLVVRAVDPSRDVRDEGKQEHVFAEEQDLEISIAGIIAMRATRPWPAVEVEWLWPESDTVHHVVLHPRGVQHAVPRARDVLSSYERFGEHVGSLFEHVPRLARVRSQLELVRGWLDDRVVPFEPMPALPASRSRSGPYRASADAETLLAQTSLPAAFSARVRDQVSRMLSLTSTHDGLASLGLSERFVWVVKQSGPVLRIPRDEMRGLFVDGERFELVFGRSTFLSVALPVHAPIRAALIDAAHEAAARLRAHQRVG
jgi:hypothetical protein